MFLAGPPMPPIFATPGTTSPRQLGPMMRAPRASAASTIWATSPRGMRSVTITISPIPASIGLEHGVLGERGRNRDDRAVRHPSAVVLDDLLDGVEDRHAVHVAALAPGRHAADDLRAVVEALAREVDGLAPGDALDDEGGVVVDEDAHAAAPWIFATARPAASCIDTERSQYSTP